MNKYKGFTLIELIFVISILLILTMMAGLNYNIIDKIEGNNQIKELVYNINQMRTYSQVHNKATVIDFNDKGYTLKFSGKSQNFNFNNKVRLIETNLNSVRFTAKGKPSYKNYENSAGTIIYGIENKIYKITIEPVTGKVNLKNVEELNEEKI